MNRTEKTGFYYGYIIVIAAFLTVALGWGTFYTFGIFFEPLLTEFGWTRTITAGAFSVAMLVAGFMAIIAGKLTDQLGSKIVSTACGVLLGSGFLLLSQINAVWQFYLLYGIPIAVGLSGCWAPITSTVARWFVKRRGLMTGIVVSGVGFGIVVIAPLTSWIIAAYGWRPAYIIIGIITLVVIIGAAQFLKRDPRQIGQLPYGENKVEQESSGSKVSGFSFQEAIHTRQFWMVAAIYFSYGFSLHTLTVHIVPHAIGLGISAASAANILATFGAISIPGRLIMGSASDRIGIKYSLVFVLGLMLVALLWLQLARELWMLYLFGAVFGFAYGGLSCLQSLTAAKLFGLSSLGVIVGTLSFSFTSGGAIGTVLAGYIFDVTGSYSLAFLISAIMALTGCVLALSLTPPIRREKNSLNPGD